jgi:hypothetical protein
MPDTLYKDLLAACKQPGCPVCRMENSAVDFYLQTALREKANDLLIRHDLRESLGFCREHTWRMRNIGLGKTMAATLGYHVVLLFAVQQLQNVDFTPKPAKRAHLFRKCDQRPIIEFETVVHALTPRQRCPVCLLSENFTRSALRALAESLQELAMSKAFTTSDGLCLPHLRQAFEQVEDEETCKTLISLNVERFDTLRRELVEVTRQIEKRSDRKTTQVDEGTWRKVINAVNGER